jgi:hypothetical protein
MSTTTTGCLARHAWSVISWIVLSGLVTGIAAALYYYQRAENELRRVVESRLAELYPHLAIRIGSARIVQAEGIQLGQISVAQSSSGTDGQRTEMAYIERLALRCDASLPALLQRKLVVKQVQVAGVTVHVQRDAKGGWNLLDLIPPKPPVFASGPLPDIVIQNASWQLRDMLDPQLRTLIGEDVELRVRLKRIGPTPGELADPAEAIPKLLMAFSGSCRTPFCQRIDVEGIVRTTDGAWTLQGRVSGAVWSADVIQNVPSMFAQRLQALAPLRAHADIDFQLGRESRQLPLSYRFNGRVTEAHWQDPRWPQPISDVSCDFLISPAGCHVRQIMASFGTARLGGNFSASSLDISQPYQLDVTLDRFPLTEGFVATLPDALQATWQKFRAEGLVSGMLRAQFDGSRHQYQTELTVQELSLKHYRFPYPVSQCQGNFKLSNERCQFDLVGSAGGTPISLQGAIEHPGPEFTGWWEAKSMHWKSVDDELIAALPANVESLIRRLQLRGNVGFRVRLQRDDPRLRPPPDMIVAFDRAWINYEGFPYPISNIKGQLKARSGRWTFESLEGWNDNCRIQCNGYWDTVDKAQPLELQFQLHDLGLDDELKHAFRTSARQVWEQLRPQGRIDQVAVRLFKTSDLMRPEVDIQLINGGGASPRESADDLQVTPAWLPLRLSNVQGEARVRGQSLVIPKLSGEHGKAHFQTSASGQLLPDGRWTISLSNLAIDRLELTESVLLALPQPLSKSVAEMGLGGTFSLAGAMRFERDDRQAPVASSWDLQVNLEQGRINNSLSMAGIFGQIDVSGESRGSQFGSRGRLRLDSLVSNGVQLTAVEGPFSVDSTRVLLGQTVPPQASNQASRPITASVYQGKASGSAELWLNPTRDFSVQVNVTSADVSQLAREWQMGHGNLAGQAFLELFLTGSNRGRQSLRGNGTAQLRNANLYELPLILALLSRIRSGRTDNTAFSTSDIAFHISDGYVYFDRFDLAGDAITLKGIGEMSLERQLSLDFYSIVGREQLWNPLVRPFLGEASRQFLLIHVDGTLSNPQTTQEVLPGLNETLQQLFPELSNMTQGHRQAEQSGRRAPLGMFPPWR